MFYCDKYQDINEEDLFGTSTKVDSIKYVLNNNNNLFQTHKMIALYGNWGSGKTSVMKTLEKQLDSYKVIFFEAWKYEDDDNIALSLLDFIINEYQNSSVGEQLITSLKIAGHTLFTYAKNLLLNTTATVGPLSADIGGAGKDTIQEMDKKYNLTSYYKMVEDFNEAFCQAISRYSNEISANKPILIMIDDLDRCEPQNIIRLLSSIKHFLIHDKLVYFCGVDKAAVENAIKIRYGKYINADDYLDKIFNISFNMPDTQLQGIIKDFLSKLANKGQRYSQDTFGLLLDFFNTIKFKNPRRVKKVLNKFIYFYELKDIGSIDSNIVKMSELNEYTLCFALFAIILCDFKRDIYNELINYEYKLEQLITKFNNSDKIFIKNNTAVERSDFIDTIIGNLPDVVLRGDIASSFEKYNDQMEGMRNNTILEVLFWLTPTDVDNINCSSFSIGDNNEKLLYDYINNFKLSADKTLYSFCNFLLKHLHKENTEFNVSLYQLLKSVGEFS